MMLGGTVSADDEFSDEASAEAQGGNGAETNTVSGSASDNAGDTFDEKDQIGVTIDGRPAPGVTLDASTNLYATDDGGDSETGGDELTSPTSDSGGDQFQSEDDSGVGGKSQSKVTTNFGTSDAEGDSASSTDTVTDNGSVGLQDDNTDNGSDNFTDANGQTTSDDEQDTDQENVQLQRTDTTTEKVQSTVSGIDLASGLNVTFKLQGNSIDTVTDNANGGGTDVHTDTLAPDGTDTSADTKSGDADGTEDDSANNHTKLTVTSQGTDSAGDQVNLLSSATLDDTETTDNSENASESADGASSDVSEQDETTDVRLTGFQGGSVVGTDPTSGIKSTVLFDNLIFGKAHDEEDIGNDDATAANGAQTDTSSDTDTGFATDGFSLDDTVSQTNPDGSPAGQPVSYGGSGNGSETELNGIWTDQGSPSTLPAAVAGGALPGVSAVVATGDTAAQGSTIGGDAVFVTGSNFTSDSQVSFDGTPAQSSIVVSPTEIIAVAPAHAAGSAHVTVANAAGTSVASAADSFTYASRDANGAPPAGGGNNGGGSGTGGTPSGGGSTSNTQPLTDAEKIKIQQQIWQMLTSIKNSAKTYQMASPNDGARKEIMKQIMLTANQAAILSAQIGQSLNPDATVTRIMNGLPVLEPVDMEAVGEPGFWEGMTPVWGSAGYAMARFEEGSWVRGSLWSLVALSDISMVRSAGTAIYKGGAKLLGKQAAAKTGIELAAEVGAAGEKAAGITAPKKAIESLSGKAVRRFPEEVTKFTVKEVKNVKYQRFTYQLQDSLHYAIMTGREFVLVVRESTVMAGPLQDAIKAGWITL